MLEDDQSDFCLNSQISRSEVFDSSFDSSFESNVSVEEESDNSKSPYLDMKEKTYVKPKLIIDILEKKFHKAPPPIINIKKINDTEVHYAQPISNKYMKVKLAFKDLLVKKIDVDRRIKGLSTIDHDNSRLKYTRNIFNVTRYETKEHNALAPLLTRNVEKSSRDHLFGFQKFFNSPTHKKPKEMLKLPKLKEVNLTLDSYQVKQHKSNAFILPSLKHINHGHVSKPNAALKKYSLFASPKLTKMMITKRQK